MSGVLTDVTEKRMQDIRIKDSFEKYRQVVEGSRDIVYCWKVKKGLITFNSKVKEYIDVEEYNDEVTGIPNRRYFMGELERAIKSCDDKKKLALVFIDSDNFKFINDTHGHYIGDVVLRGICEKLYYVLEKDNLLARYGGDEFVIVMENL